MMVNWAVQSELPVLILLTKADKLTRGAAQNTLLKVRKSIEEFSEVEVQLFSAMNRVGIEGAQKVIADWLKTE